MSDRTTEADRQQALYSWLSAAQVARVYFADAEHPEATAISADTILRWHDDPAHPLSGADFSADGAKRRLILFRPQDVEAYINGLADAA